MSRCSRRAQKVMWYTQHLKPQGHDGGAPAAEEAALEQMLLSILEKHPRLAAAASKEPPVSPAKGPWKTHGG